MPNCSVVTCKNRSATKTYKNSGVTYHIFPKNPSTKEKWIDATGRGPNWFPVQRSVMCSEHFQEKCFQPLNKSRRLFESAIPTLKICQMVSSSSSKPDVILRESPNSVLVNSTRKEIIVNEQDVPGPSEVLDTRNLSDSGSRDQDPLSRVIEQCRFCGEFSKDCVAVSSDMTYLAGNKTTLALNDNSVQLDFNDRSLPKTVCRDCDAKLQEFCDFVKVIKAAQDTLINVAEEKEEFGTEAELEETTTDFEERAEAETETLIVKTEYDSQQEDSDDDKEGILDSLTVGETVFVRETHKRKSDTDTTKPKKFKTKEKCDDDDHLVIDIKEEVVEKDANDGHGLSEVSDTGTDVKLSELELATGALVFEMAGEGTSEYQAYGSDR